MRVYGEAYLFINFWMDFLSLLLAARLRRARFRGLRAAAGAVVGAVTALLAWTMGGAMRGLPALFLSMLAITVISFDKAGFFLFPWVIASALLLCGLTDALLNNGASAPAALIVCGAAAYWSEQFFDRFMTQRLATVMAVLFAVVVYVIALFLFRAIKREDVLQMPKGNKIVKVIEKRHLIR